MQAPMRVSQVNTNVLFEIISPTTYSCIFFTKISVFSQMSVRQLLMRTVKGKQIMAIFAKKKEIDTRKISSLIINYEIDSTGRYK